jgi:hypothetical protein
VVESADALAPRNSLSLSVLSEPRVESVEPLLAPLGGGAPVALRFAGAVGAADASGVGGPALLCRFGRAVVDGVPLVEGAGEGAGEASAAGAAGSLVGVLCVAPPAAAALGLAPSALPSEPLTVPLAFSLNGGIA